MFVMGRRLLPDTTGSVWSSPPCLPSQSPHIVVMESWYQAQKPDNSLSMRHIATYAIAPWWQGGRYVLPL